FHTLAINEAMAKYGSAGDLSVKDGRYFPNKAPGVSFAGVPIYAALRVVRGGPQNVSESSIVFWMRLFICMLPAAIAAELMRRIPGGHLPPIAAEGGAVVFALGTLMWPYGTLLMSHGPTACALVLAWWALATARDRDSDALYVIAGAGAGLAVLLEYTS